MPKDLLARAQELLDGDVPRLAQRAERLVLRVLFVAGQPEGARGDEDIRHAASRIRLAPAEPLAVVSPDEARAMRQQARDIASRRGAGNDLAALDLLTRAFAANPLDVETVGSLAWLWMKQRPWQADVARQLALHALTTPHPAHPHGRFEDWTTFAVASALSGRERDARNAWLVTLALAPDPGRPCRAAVNAYAIHGERVGRSAEAMLYRAHAAGRSPASALCEWPPHWQTGGAGPR